MASSATSHPASRSGNRGQPSNYDAGRRGKEYGARPHNLDIYDVQELHATGIKPMSAVSQWVREPEELLTNELHRFDRESDAVENFLRHYFYRSIAEYTTQHNCSRVLGREYVRH